MVRPGALVLANRYLMINNLNLRVILVCLLGMTAFAWADQDRAERRYGTYTLADRPGYVKSIGSTPLCDASAEKLLDRWRGSLLIKYSKGAVSVNGEPWIFDGDWSTNAGAHRPPDPSVKGRLFVGLDRSYKRGMGSLTFSDEDRTCSTTIAFIGKWAEP